jgi:hypothetical protein
MTGALVTKSTRSSYDIMNDLKGAKIHDAVGIEGNLFLNGAFTSVGISAGVWKTADEWSLYVALTPGGQVTNS